MKIQDIIDQFKTSPFYLNAEIPLGYTPSLPIVTQREGKAIVIVPFLRYAMTGQVDRTDVLPPRYIFTLTVEKGKPVAFVDMKYDTRFQKIDFNRPIGLFRHQAIRHLGKQEYWQKRAELTTLLDSLALAVTNPMAFDEHDEMRLRALYTMLLEPSLRPFYMAIDADFTTRFVVGE